MMYFAHIFALKGNKGAVGVSFMFNGTSFGFVNCHLTSGNEKITRYSSTDQYTIRNHCICLFSGHNIPFVACQKHQLSLCSNSDARDFCRRNQNYLDILRLLSLGDKQLSSFDISLRFTHLFWLGDLNYRLDMDIQVKLSTSIQSISFKI